MKVRYQSNRIAGIISILAGIVCIYLIPRQIGTDFMTTYGITSRTVPYGVAVLWIVCGIVLLVRSLFLKQDTEKTLDLVKELKALAYMGVLVVYCLTFRKSFLIATSILGVVTLAFTGAKKVSYYLITLATVAIIYVVFVYAMHVALP